MGNDLIIKKPELLSSEFFDEEFFMKNWRHFIELDLPNRRGADNTGDTLRTYYSNINHYIAWCYQKNLSPLQLKSFHIDGYIWELYHRDKPCTVSTVALKLSAIRKFYQAAVRREIIEKNPAKDIKAGTNPNAIKKTNFLIAEQLEYLINLIPNDNKEDHLRARCMIAFMGIEGLRTVEIIRMNIDDINWQEQNIYIRGKGHNAYIRPTNQSFKILGDYINSKQHVNRDDRGIPVFTVILSNNNKFGRLTRCAVRDIIDHWLLIAGFKAKGISCHVLRHSCGSILYKETKNLQIVKEVLRHGDIKMASKYAHLQDRATKQYTDVIPVKIK